MAPETSTHLEPLVSRLFHGVVIFSKSWRGDLWLYLKNEHIVLSLFAAHSKHPFSKYDRAVVTCISVMVAYGLDCCFSSTGSPTAALIMSMTIGVVVQSLFDGSLKFFSTCPCVHTGWLSRACGGCVRKCCLCIGRCFTSACCLIGVGILVLGVVLLWTNNPDEFGSASRNFGASKASAFFITTWATCCVTFLLTRRKQMRPFLIAKSPAVRDPMAMDWLQGGCSSPAALTVALKAWGARKKVYGGPRSAVAWCFCMCCCTFGGGPPDNTTWVKWFRKEAADSSGGDVEAADGDEANPGEKASDNGGGGGDDDDDTLAYLKDLLTFYDLPDLAPWYEFKVKVRLCFIDIKFNKDGIPEERRFKAPSRSGATRLVVKAAQVAPIAAFWAADVAPKEMGEMERGTAVAAVEAAATEAVTAEVASTEAASKEGTAAEGTATEAASTEAASKEGTAAEGTATEAVAAEAAEAAEASTAAGAASSEPEAPAAAGEVAEAVEGGASSGEGSPENIESGKSEKKE